MSFCGCQSTIRSSLQPARLLSPPLVRQPCCSARSGLHGRDQTQRDSAIMKRDNDMGLFPTDFNKRERRLCAFCYSCMYLHKGVRGCFFLFAAAAMQRQLIIAQVLRKKVKKRIRLKDEYFFLLLTTPCQQIWMTFILLQLYPLKRKHSIHG